MPDFSALVPETHRNISPGFVETLIQTQREELFTGLMRLSYSSGEHLIFPFLEGIQQKLYRCQNESIQIVPRKTWLDSLDHSNAVVGLLRLPVEAMRFTRVAYEAPIRRVETSVFTFEELSNNAVKWAVGQDPSVVRIETEGVKKYYLIAGRSTPIIEELSFTEEGTRFSVNDASFPRTLPKGEYQVTRYISNREHESWREFELRLAFNPLMRMLLSRFSELVGRVLTERLCDKLSLWAREGGWNITVTSNGAVNRHYFDSLENAATVYVDLLRHFREEAVQAIGPRMVDGILQETLIKLDPYRRELLTQYGVGSMPGVVWR
ncbi:MAG TPA: hypothetical protein VK249_09440 [Anaerolineales bacterium]|nr:hypothetical protein [Anaerolineales bacterium]